MISGVSDMDNSLHNTTANRNSNSKFEEMNYTLSTQNRPKLDEKIGGNFDELDNETINFGEFNAENFQAGFKKKFQEKLAAQDSSQEVGKEAEARAEAGTEQVNPELATNSDFLTESTNLSQTTCTMQTVPGLTSNYFRAPEPNTPETIKTQNITNASTVFGNSNNSPHHNISNLAKDITKMSISKLENVSTIGKIHHKIRQRSVTADELRSQVSQVDQLAKCQSPMKNVTINLKEEIVQKEEVIEHFESKQNESSTITRDHQNIQNTSQNLMTTHLADKTTAICNFNDSEFYGFENGQEIGDVADETLPQYFGDTTCDISSYKFPARLEVLGGVG